MTDDVNQPAASTNESGEPTPSTTSQGSEPTVTSQGEESKTPTQAESKTDTKGEEPDKSVPLETLLAERRKYKERIRALQRGQTDGSRQTAQPQQAQGQGIDPRYVQQLQTKVAIGELQEFARQKVRDYPDLPKHLKRALVNNPRGFLKLDTQDVEGGKLDLEDFLDDEQERYEREQAKVNPPAAKKEVQVAGGNTPDGTQPGATPADIQKILETPVDEWTKEQDQALKEYKASHA